MQVSVAVVCFGVKSTKRIIKVLGSLDIDYQVVDPNSTPIHPFTHIILSGGAKHVYNPDFYDMPTWVLESNAPVFGICYGLQLITKIFGGCVRRMSSREYGLTDVVEIIDGEQTLTKRWMNRYDAILKGPPGFIITGVTAKNHVAALTDGHRWSGVQYHPESKKQLDLDIFRRFLSIENKS